MLLKNNLIGKRILLRAVLESDAEFILGLRLNPALNQYIHKTNPSIDVQKKWIREQQLKENDYYMIIEDFDKNRLGTISVYNINKDIKTFEWGRWLILPNTPFYVAAESSLITYNFAFNYLLLEEAIFMAKSKNVSMVNYLQKCLQSEVTERNDSETWYRFCRKDFLCLLKRHKNFHNIKF